MAVPIGFIIVGVLLVGGSRVFADEFKIKGNTSVLAKWLGRADDYLSRLMRYVAAVLVGLVFVGAGVADLISR